MASTGKFCGAGHFPGRKILLSFPFIVKKRKEEERRKGQEEEE
jgi:hypothetical protein